MSTQLSLILSAFISLSRHFLRASSRAAKSRIQSIALTWSPAPVTVVLWEHLSATCWQNGYCRGWAVSTSCLQARRQAPFAFGHAFFKLQTSCVPRVERRWQRNCSCRRRPGMLRAVQPPGGDRAGHGTMLGTLPQGRGKLATKTGTSALICSCPDTFLSNNNINSGGQRTACSLL